MAIVIQVTKGKPSVREPIPLTGGLFLFVHDGGILEVAPPLGGYDGVTEWMYWNRHERKVVGKAAQWLTAGLAQKLLEAKAAQKNPCHVERRSGYA